MSRTSKLKGNLKGRVILSEILDFHVGEKQPDEQNSGILRVSEGAEGKKDELSL